MYDAVTPPKTGVPIPSTAGVVAPGIVWVRNVRTRFVVAGSVGPVVGVTSMMAASP